MRRRMLNETLVKSCTYSGATENNNSYDLGGFVSKKRIKIFTSQEILDGENPKENIKYVNNFPLLGLVLASLIFAPYIGVIFLLDSSLFGSYFSITFASIVVALLFIEACAIQEPIIAKIGLCATGFIIIFEIYLTFIKC